MPWHPVADTADFTGDGVIGRDCAGRRIALYHVAGAYHATADLCTHAHARLSEGEVVEGYIECPLHFGLFEIATGTAAGAPVTRNLATYPVRVSGTRIEVEIAE